MPDINPVGRINLGWGKILLPLPPCITFILQIRDLFLVYLRIVLGISYTELPVSHLIGLQFAASAYEAE